MSFSLGGRRFAACVVVALGFAAGNAALAQGKVLKFIPQADLRILDPIATTAYITRNHGYMVYDTLFAMDEKFQVQPQMVDKWEVSKDGLTLHLHAARRAQVPRRPAGARRPTASPRSSAGPSATRSARSSPKRTDVVDRGRRQDLHAQAEEAVPAARSRRSAKPSSNVPFIMPERIAKTDAVQEHRRCDRLGPVQVREGRVGAGQQGRLREEHRLRAAQGSAVVGRRRQGGQGRPRRVDLHPRLGDRRRGAQRGRGRLVGAAAAGPDPAARAEQGHHGQEHRPAGLDGHDPLQLPASAVQQPEDAPGAALRGRTSRTT